MCQLNTRNMLPKNPQNQSRIWRDLLIVLPLPHRHSLRPPLQRGIHRGFVALGYLLLRKKTANIKVNGIHLFSPLIFNFGISISVCLHLLISQYYANFKKIKFSLSHCHIWKNFSLTYNLQIGSGCDPIVCNWSLFQRLIKTMREIVAALRC